MNLENDLNQTITAAVQARVTADVVAALSSDEALGAMVTAALQELVSTGDWNRREPLITSLLKKTVAEVAKATILEEIKTFEPMIRSEVKAALAKSLGVITDSLVDGFVDNVTGTYPSINVSFGNV